MNAHAIILFAHGARDPQWAEPFEIIQRQLQAARPDTPVELAFQAFMTPTLEAAKQAWTIDRELQNLSQQSQGDQHEKR